MYRRGRISNRMQHWVLGGVCRYSFDVCLHLHLPFISWRDWWSVFRRVSQQQSWSEDLRGNNSEVRGGGTEWPTIAQNLKSICFQAFLGAFLPQVQGSWWILCPEGSEFVWQKGCRELNNAWLWVAFDQSLSYSGELIESCHNQAFLTPCPPLSYIFWTLWTRGFTGTPCTWGKNAPRNALSSFDNYGSFSPRSEWRGFDWGRRFRQMGGVLTNIFKS